jgi:hypothetical protein
MRDRRIRSGWAPNSALDSRGFFSPFVCEAKFSSSAGYSFMVFDEEAGMSYALIECVAVDQSNYVANETMVGIDGNALSFLVR